MTIEYRRDLVRDGDIYAALDSWAKWGSLISGAGLVHHLVWRCPWLRWDPNPFPKFNLLRFRR